jgi:Transposase and inactivated derivatives
MDNQSLAHSRYNCTYHIVFIPKYRRKVMFGELRREVGEILGKVCKMEEVTILKAATLPDHVVQQIRRTSFMQFILSSISCLTDIPSILSTPVSAL